MTTPTDTPTEGAADAAPVTDIAEVSARHRERHFAVANARLAKAEMALDAAIQRLVAALPPLPSGRDVVQLAALARELPDLSRELARSVTYVNAALPPIGSPARRQAMFDTSRANHAIAQTNEVVQSLRHILTDPRAPLFANTAADTMEDRRLTLLSRAFVDMEYAVSGSVQGPEMDEGHYHFVAFAPSRFLMHMEAAWRVLRALGRTQDTRFLDVGAGAGGKVMLARPYFSTVEGLELDSVLCERARALGLDKPGKARVFQGDALAFDGYDRYDLVYFYCPFKDRDAQSDLERRIWESVRPGTVIVAPKVLDTFIHDQPCVVENIVVKGFEGAALEALVAEAGRVGPAVPPPDFARDPTSVTRPAMLAIAAAGFGRTGRLTAPGRSRQPRL